MPHFFFFRSNFYVKSNLKIGKRENCSKNLSFISAFTLIGSCLVMKIRLIFIAICITFVHCKDWKGKCKLKDTINITGGHEDNNGNFIHQGVNYSPGSFGVSNYILVKTQKILVEQHMRGCVCLYKTCIRICCASKSECSSDFSFLLPMHDEGEYELNSNSAEFGILRGTPCAHTYKLEPADYEYDQWFFKAVKIFLN